MLQRLPLPSVRTPRRNIALPGALPSSWGARRPTQSSRRYATTTVSFPMKAKVLCQASSDGVSSSAGFPPAARRVWRSTIRALSSLPLAIGELTIIAAASAIGTIVEQDKPTEFYEEFYPSAGPKLLGFVTSDLILLLGLDHVYRTPGFLGLCFALGASLVACTVTNQWPVVKVAQRFKFLTAPDKVMNRPLAEVLPRAKITDFGRILLDSGFQVFRRGDSLYAFKGLAGRYAPIGVHIAIILTMLGAIMGVFGSWKGNVFAPEGSTFRVEKHISPASPLASAPTGAQARIRVDDFRIDYGDDGSVLQYYSDLSVLDSNGQAILQKTIFVNEPMRLGGVTLYQTDWSLAGLKVRVRPENAPIQSSSDPESTVGRERGPNGPTGTGRIVNLPLFNLGKVEGLPGRAWGAFLPVGPDSEADSVMRGAGSMEGAQGGPETGRRQYVMVVAQGMQTAAFYGSQGEFVGVRRAGSGTPLSVDGTVIELVDIVGSTGIELRSDPGVPIVYAGFGLMMITTLLSCLTFSQVWALQQGEDLYIGGRTNRASVEFQADLDQMLDRVPERR